MPVTGEQLNDLLQDICADKISGSVTIFRNALDLLKQICSDMSDNSLRNFLEIFVETVVGCHGKMAIIEKLHGDIRDIIDANDDASVIRESLLHYVAEETNSLEESFRKIAERVEAFLEGKSTIITLSRSETVLIVIKELSKRGMVEGVIVSESRPSMEGVIMSKELAIENIPVTLVVDSAMDRMSAIADIGIIGADAVYENGDVKNKIGSRSLALSCKSRQIPFIVVSESSKLTGNSTGNIEHYDLRPMEEITKEALPEKISVLNFYFEIVERSLIEGIILEDRTI